MGGMEGSRGYVYQGIASTLNALIDQNWDSIQIEFPTKGNKVDIALAKGTVFVKAIQVKSTENTFQPNQIKSWIQDLADDYSCQDYELVLIGQCSGTGLTFINAIDKYYKKCLDKKAADALSGFNTAILDSASVKVRRLSFDLESLLANVRDALFKYVSQKGLGFNHDQINMLANATICDHLLSSTNGSCISRESFEADLQSRLKGLHFYSTFKRIPVCVQSFDRGTTLATIAAERRLDLRGFFNDPMPLNNDIWNRRILHELEDFFEQLDSTEKYAVYLETHCSIAFAVGRACDSKSGIDIVPYQKTVASGIKLWSPDEKLSDSYSGWTVEEVVLSTSSHDIALILNGAHDIDRDVISYIEQQNLPVGRILSCTVGGENASHLSVIDGHHALLLASGISSLLDARTVDEKNSAIHVFAAMPNAFMFYMGKMSRLFGEINLYEFNIQRKGPFLYSNSFTF